MDIVEKYKKFEYPLPKGNLEWRAYGKGMENFGDDKKPAKTLLPVPGDDELLVRVDAVGLCFSDTKIIKAGSEHPRLQGRDLKKNPVILGHEVSITVVKAGKNRKIMYKPGDRFIIQADVYYKGRGIAYGYILPGGLTQYELIGREILDGDGESYLIPIHKNDISYSEAALVEPWACVVASYRIKHREGIKNDGLLLILGSEKERDYQFEDLFINNLPKSVVLAKVVRKNADKLKQVIKNRQVNTIIENSLDVKELSTQYTGGKGFDDIIVLGDANSETIASAADNLAYYGILNYMATSKEPQIVNIDAGKIHYDRISFVGSLGIDIVKPYVENLDYQLKGDSVILFGAGGPMGQMHVQLAIESKNPPKIVVATDLARDRIDALMEKFETRAEERGIRFHVVNPEHFSDPEDYRKEILRLNDGLLYDYVICLAAVPSVIEDSSLYLGDKSILNIFAGVSKGTIVKLNIKDVASKAVRYIGSSGSAIDDMEYTLRKVESGELDTNNSVAGISGMSDVWNGLEAVRLGTIPGKIVVFPHIKDMALTSLKELKKKYPRVGALLSEDGKWTKEAEEELLREMVELE